MTQRPRYQDSGGSKLLFFSEILLISACFYGSAAIDFDLDPTLYFLYEGGLERFLFAAATILTGLYFHHLYSDVRVRSRVQLLQQLCEVFGVALIAQSLADYIKPDWILPRWLMIYGALFSLFAIFAWRVVYSSYFLNLVRRHRILFIGCNRTVREIARQIANSPGWGYEILGVVDDQPGSVHETSPIGEYLGPYSKLPSVVKSSRPDRIVVGLEDRRAKMPVAELLELHYAGLQIEEASIAYEAFTQRLCSRDLDARDLIFSRDLNPPTNQLSFQRAIDIPASLMLLLLFSPLIAFIFLLLQLTSREPALIRHRRAGLNGKPFDMLRFRKGPRLGLLFDRLHLDALPELFNVLRGDMSLVGPRPEAPELRDQLSEEYPLYGYRLNVRPGMTGWAQVNLQPSEQQRNPVLSLEYDLYYIKHISQTLNAYILMTTLKNRLIWADQPE